MLRPILGQPVHDPTSGFVGVNRRALAVFGKSFPLEYPEIEALVVLQRKRFRFREVHCRMLPRTTGRSSITAVKSILLHHSRAAWGARQCAEIREKPQTSGEEVILDRLLHCTTALSLVLIVLVLTSVRRAHIRVEYSVSWLLASVALLGVSLNPSVLNMAASLFGIDYAPVALLLIAGAVFLLVFFRLSVIISKLKDG